MAKPDDIQIPYHGRKHPVRYAQARNGRMLARQFLEGLNRPERAKFFYLIATLADEGEIVNEQQFRRVSEHIWEIKIHSPGLRLLCFLQNGKWYLTHGCPKLKKKEFQQEIVKGERIRAEHLACGDR